MNACDMDEVKHQAIQKFVELRKADKKSYWEECEWKYYGYSISIKPFKIITKGMEEGRLYLKDQYLAHNSGSLCDPQPDEVREAITYYLQQLKESIKKEEDKARERKCKELLRVLSHKPWWRFWK